MEKKYKMAYEEKNRHESGHMLKMALACIIPFAIFLILPFLGISGKWTSIGAIGLMIFLHVLIMKDHFKSHSKQKEGIK